MSAPAFTPGPWLATNAHTGPSFWRVESCAEGYLNDGWVVAAEVHGPDGDANAHLIAAAPDLYEALQSIIECVDPEGLGTFDAASEVAGNRPSNGELVLKGSFIERCIKAAAALAKASGGGRTMTALPQIDWKPELSSLATCSGIWNRMASALRDRDYVRFDELKRQFHAGLREGGKR